MHLIKIFWSFFWYFFVSKCPWIWKFFVLIDLKLHSHSLKQKKNCENKKKTSFIQRYSTGKRKGKSSKLEKNQQDEKFLWIFFESAFCFSLRIFYNMKTFLINLLFMLSRKISIFSKTKRKLSNFPFVTHAYY